MKRVGKIGGALLIASGLFISYAYGTQGLSTSFSDIQIRGVPLGQPFVVRNSEGEGIRIHNLGSQRIRVRIEALPPKETELRGGALAIPDVRWIRIEPDTLEIPAGGTGQSRIHLTVPKASSNRKKTFQVTIWSHSISLDGHALEIGMGLLSRLRFTTQSK